jgi:hypothetical protein
MMYKNNIFLVLLLNTLDIKLKDNATINNLLEIFIVIFSVNYNFSCQNKLCFLRSENASYCNANANYRGLFPSLRVCFLKITPFAYNLRHCICTVVATREFNPTTVNPESLLLLPLLQIAVVLYCLAFLTRTRYESEYIYRA